MREFVVIGRWELICDTELVFAERCLMLRGLFWEATSSSQLAAALWPPHPALTDAKPWSPNKLSNGFNSNLLDM